MVTIVSITYQLGSKLYINLTNQCTNQCQFCVRQYKDGLGGENLWLEKEPTPNEVLEAIGQADRYQEIVFCGYGEPLIRLEAVVKIANNLQENYPQVPVRLNTNGLANLIHGRNVLPDLEGRIDAISISLNAADAETYQRVSQSEFGLESFKAVVEFIKRARQFIPEVTASVVRSPEIDIEKCRQLAERLGVKFRVRG